MILRSWQQSHGAFRGSNRNMWRMLLRGGIQVPYSLSPSPTHRKLPTRVHQENLLEDCQQHEQLLMASRQEIANRPDHFGTLRERPPLRRNITDAIQMFLLARTSVW